MVRWQSLFPMVVLCVPESTKFFFEKQDELTGSFTGWTKIAAIIRVVMSNGIRQRSELVADAQSIATRVG